MHRLTAANLWRVTGVSTPTYDRAQRRTGIVHFGMGNFHRSHEAMYVDRLMESGHALDWGICGVGLLAQDRLMRDVMEEQDCLYTLLLRHPDGALEPRVIGSITECLFGPDDPELVFARLVDPAVRIVSLTVTEGGYLTHAASGEFDPEDPSVLHDLAHPGNPSTAFGYLVEALRRRRAAGVAPFTVLSCDNLQGNGDHARRTVTALAGLLDPALAGWIGGNVAFPNCMVDRITPATSEADRTATRESSGVDDHWPVAAEPFAQWIVEDDFPGGRPDLERAGVQFVQDVKPYELMKLRLLNASHQAIAYIGASWGCVFVDEAMEEELLRDYLLAYMTDEAAPTLGALPGIDVEAYIHSVIERFSNPRMRDTLVRLATDGSTRMATFIVPAIRANLEAGRTVDLGAGTVACWAQFWEGVARGHTPRCGVPADGRAGEMLAAAMEQEHDPLAFVRLESLLGDLAASEEFCDAFARARDRLRAGGTRALLRELLSG